VWSRGIIALTNAKKTYSLADKDLRLLQSRKRNNGWNRMTFFLELDVFLLALSIHSCGIVTGKGSGEREGRHEGEGGRDAAYSSLLAVVFQKKKRTRLQRNAS
jgi:hypothetical protein